LAINVRDAARATVGGHRHGAHHRIRPQRHPPGGRGHWERRHDRVEHGPDIAALYACAAEAARRAALVRARQLRETPLRYRQIHALGRAAEQFLSAVVRHAGQELAVRQWRETRHVAADADVFLDVIVKGRKVRVADGPVFTEPIARGRFEIEVAQPVRRARLVE